MAIVRELWKKDGTKYFHSFENEQAARCTEAWQVKEGVPCPFIQAKPIGDTGYQADAVKDKLPDEPSKESPTATNGGRGKRNARSKR